MEKNYKKMGGWLLVFLVFRAIAIVANLNLLNQTAGIKTEIEIVARYYGSGYMMTYYLVIVDTIISIAGNIGIIILLFKKNKAALRWIKKILVSIVMIDIAIGVGSMLYLSSIVSESVFSSSDVSNIIGALTGLVLWYQYLAKSSRVATYFDENYEESIETIDVIVD